ncbi:MAG: spore coat protein CotJB [Anaerovoracaceae bacterium]
MGKNDMLRMIQQLNFTMIELGLFLNNQPDCQNALALYERTRLMYIDARREYENLYGPLTYDGVNTERDGWSWINDPWPWEGEY